MAWKSTWLSCELRCNLAVVSTSVLCRWWCDEHGCVAVKKIPHKLQAQFPCLADQEVKALTHAKEQNVARVVKLHDIIRTNEQDDYLILE